MLEGTCRYWVGAALGWKLMECQVIFMVSDVKFLTEKCPGLQAGCKPIQSCTRKTDQVLGVASINTLVCRCWRSACFPVWSCDWVDVLSSSSGMGAGSELVCLAVCFLDGAAFYSCFLCLCFRLLEPQSASADGRSHWAWFCWRFLPVKREFFLSTVAASMLSVRDCIWVNESMQSTGFP